VPPASQASAVHGSPSSQSAAVVQQLVMGAWTQVWVERSQLSAVQAL
jgi:hypothetical protein